MFTSMDLVPTVYIVSLFPSAPVNGRAAALGPQELMIQWRKPDLVEREQIYEKT